MKKKKRFIADKYLPHWAVVPLLTILLVNSIVYWGGGILAKNQYHYDFTTTFDRMVPLVPEFVWVYILAYVFWACGYVLASWRGKEIFYRFVATDLAIHGICFIVFVLLPTTNIRPDIPGNTISEQVLQIVYDLDGGSAPSNLLPSIHCYVSWLCYKVIKGAKEIPVWYQAFSFVFAVLVIISTQVLKQHYIVDAITAVILVELFWALFKRGNKYIGVMKFFEQINKKVWNKRKMGECL